MIFNTFQRWAGLRAGFAAAMAVATLCAVPAFAQKTAADISVADFFKRAEYQDMQLSPSGKLLSALTPFKGRANLVIVDLEKRTSNVITAFDSLDATGVVWVNDDRLCFRVSDTQDASGRLNIVGQYCIDRDGNNLRDFSNIGVKNPSQGIRTQLSILGLVPDGPNELFVAMNERTREYVDVYRLDTRTGRFKLLSFDSPGQTTRWVLDRKGVARVAVRDESKGVRSIWYRDGEGSKWEKINEHGLGGEAIDPLAFDGAGTLYVASNIGRDKWAVFSYDTRAKKLDRVIAEHSRFDITGGLIFTPKDYKLIAVRYQAEKPTRVWLDPEWEKLQKSLDATYPKNHNEMRFARDSTDKVLVFSQSDVDPGRYALLDRTKMALEEVLPLRKWLDPKLMAERKFIVYKARDGKEVPAYLTLPKGAELKNLPLIVNIHGGPQLRQYEWIDWGRWPDAQFFASRGYAVLEPEPRGSDGFGRAHLQGGWGKWGLEAQDDITDGALHLVKEGIVDKNRMCLHGGSYGGYATLQGMVKEPDLFKCGNAFVAVSDILLGFDDGSDRAKSDDWLPDQARIWGDPKTMRAQLEKTSPARNANNIKGAIMLTMGSDDDRVPLVHGSTMKKAMEKAGVKHEYKVYTGEGHGYNKAENVVDFYTRVLKFFDEHIGKK